MMKYRLLTILVKGLPFGLLLSLFNYFVDEDGEWSWAKMIGTGLIFGIIMAIFDPLKPPKAKN